MCHEAKVARLFLPIQGYKFKVERLFCKGFCEVVVGGSESDLEWFFLPSMV